MSRLPKLVQFLGIVITGIGLIYGIAQNDMQAEFMYLGSGVVVFIIGYVLEGRT
jgi:hypothetical protein